LTRDLHEQPRHDAIRDRNFVDVVRFYFATSGVN
jgi:hypothetical protein